MIAAGRAFAAAMRPYGTGGPYLNFTPEAHRVRGAYPDDTYARPVALKDTYDPANLFCLNPNIRPSQSAPARAALRRSSRLACRVSRRGRRPARPG
jgi:hypothetical protein